MLGVGWGVQRSAPPSLEAMCACSDPPLRPTQSGAASCLKRHQPPSKPTSDPFDPFAAILLAITARLYGPEAGHRDAALGK